MSLENDCSVLQLIEVVQLFIAKVFKGIVVGKILLHAYPQWDFKARHDKLLDVSYSKRRLL